MKQMLLLLALCGVSVAAGAQSMGHSGMGGSTGMGPMMANGGQGAASSPMAQGATMLPGGEVRKVDKDAQKITIRHGPIPNLDMPAMTMVFRVKDPGMLDRVKAGDKVRFAADSIGGALTVTQIELATK